LSDVTQERREDDLKRAYINSFSITQDSSDIGSNGIASASGRKVAADEKQGAGHCGQNDIERLHSILDND